MSATNVADGFSTDRLNTNGFNTTGRGDTQPREDAPELPTPPYKIPANPDPAVGEPDKPAPLPAVVPTVPPEPVADDPIGNGGPIPAPSNEVPGAPLTPSSPAGVPAAPYGSAERLKWQRPNTAIQDEGSSASLQQPSPPVDDVWERIRRGFKMPELTTKLAANRTTWYAAQPDYLARMSTRASLYLFHIVEEIEKRGMPTELALLPFVESAMQPEAVSSAAAAGLWQFIPSTGKVYALEQSLWKDERRDVVESTRAALDYLQKLYNDFGDWHLALAAYNCGEGGVGRALLRNRARGKPLDFSSLPLPRETQYYVPKLQAIKNIVREPGRYAIALPAIRNEPYFVAISKLRDIDVATAARLAELPIDQFRALNPAFNRPVIVGADSPNILLPANRADVFRGNLAAWEATGQPLASWTTHTLAAGETLDKVAQRVGVSENQLREANRVPPRYRLTPGSTILIPRDETMGDDIAAEKLGASFSIVPEASSLRQVTYRVKRGDTLQSVARRYNVQPQDIIAWNRLQANGLFAGQRLTLTVHRVSASKPAKPTVVANASVRSAAHAAARR